MAETCERRGTVVVGAGAAGLAAAVRARDADVLVLDAADRVGDSWRRRYEGLSLFTPARYCALPGLPLPLPPRERPTKDQYADYLARYAGHAGVPVRAGCRVRRHEFRDGVHRLETGGTTIETRTLIWAAGGHAVPSIPRFAAGLRPHQTHSTGLRSVADLPPGPVLVVGAGQSGADIALAAAAGHRTLLAGPGTGHVPPALAASRPLHALYRLRLPRRAAGLLRRRGSPLIRQTARRLSEAGVERLPRVRGVHDGRPQLADGRVLDVASVVWCTGSRPEAGWLDPRALGPDGWPAHRRGVSTTLPGLAYVGLPGQNTVASGFLAGMVTDTAHLAAVGAL